MEARGNATERRGVRTEEKENEFNRSKGDRFAFLKKPKGERVYTCTNVR